MAYKRFYWAIVWRVLGITASILLAAYSLFQSGYFLVPTILATATAVQVLLLIQHLNRTNRAVTRLLQALDYDDFSVSFTELPDERSYRELAKTLQQVMQAFRQVQYQKEEYHRFLQNIVQQIPVGVIVFQDNGQVALYNEAGRKMFGLSGIHELKDLAVAGNQVVAFLGNQDPGRKEVIEFYVAGHHLQLAVQTTLFTISGISYRMITLQNLRQVLDEKELESWGSLISILTHEIMNALTPISSLAATARTMAKQPLEHRDELQAAMEAMERRSNGLMGFVKNYREIARLPLPQLQEIDLGKWLEEQVSLAKSEGMNYLKLVPLASSIRLQADPDLLNQVMLNLLKNARDAVSGTTEPIVSLSCYRDEQYAICIELRDNGPGIPPDVLERVFIPFFSTKPQGSGIGLSLCKQVMYVHGGQIEIDSTEDKGTAITLRFPVN